MILNAPVNFSKSVQNNFQNIFYKSVPFPKKNHGTVNIVYFIEIVQP